MAAITVGQRFESLVKFKDALRTWAIAESFTPAILDSDSRRVRAGCRTSPNCPFRIRCNFNSKTGIALVTTLENVHTCTSQTNPGASNIKRAETCKLKFLLEVVPQLINVDRSTSTKAIIDAVNRRYGREIAMRQAQKVKAMLVAKTKGSCVLCGDANHTRDSCPSDRRSSFQPQHDSVEENEEDDDQMMDDVQAQVQVSRPPVQRAADRTPNPNYQQVTARRNAVSVDHSHSAIDPSLINNHNAPYPVLQNSPSPQHHVSQAQGNEQHPTPNPSQHSYTMIEHHPATNPSSQQTYVTGSRPQAQNTNDARMEASHMMVQAAQMMKEAARLNAEAARLNSEAARLIASS